MIYVDDKKYKFKQMQMCHLMADSLDELHTFAQMIKLKKEWFQLDHYDISQSKRREAIKLGAIPVNSQFLVQLRIKHFR